ncbi:MAG: acyl carrier protein [Iphinoe sp. HA4291-MV1]|jgi:acyl carrier protein|nr:acyl carrier protein [Iphinoe sp. HA4291-MV1]
MEVQNLERTDMLVVPESIIADSTIAEASGNASKELPTTAEIQAWIVSYVANLLEIEPDEVDVTIPFDRYGLDSSATVGLTGELADWLERDIDPTLMYDYPTVQALVRYLRTEL